MLFLLKELFKETLSNHFLSHDCLEALHTYHPCLKGCFALSSLLLHDLKFFLHSHSYSSCLIPGSRSLFSRTFSTSEQQLFLEFEIDYLQSAANSAAPGTRQRTNNSIYALKAVAQSQPFSLTTKKYCRIQKYPRKKDTPLQRSI